MAFKLILANLYATEVSVQLIEKHCILEVSNVHLLVTSTDKLPSPNATTWLRLVRPFLWGIQIIAEQFPHALFENVEKQPNPSSGVHIPLFD